MSRRATRRNPVAVTPQDAAAALRARALRPERTARRLKACLGAVRGTACAAEASEVLAARGLIPDAWVIDELGVAHDARAGFARIAVVNEFGKKPLTPRALAIAMADVEGVAQGLALLREVLARERLVNPSEQSRPGVEVNISVYSAQYLRRRPFGAFSWTSAAGLERWTQRLRQIDPEAMEIATSLANEIYVGANGFEPVVPLGLERTFAGWAAQGMADPRLIRRALRRDAAPPNPFEPLLEVALLGYGFEVWSTMASLMIPVPARQTTLL